MAKWLSLVWNLNCDLKVRHTCAKFKLASFIKPQSPKFPTSYTVVAQH